MSRRMADDIKRIVGLDDKSRPLQKRDPLPRVLGGYGVSIIEGEAPIPLPEVTCCDNFNYTVTDSVNDWWWGGTDGSSNDGGTRWLIPVWESGGPKGVPIENVVGKLLYTSNNGATTGLIDTGAIGEHIATAMIGDTWIASSQDFITNPISRTTDSGTTWAGISHTPGSANGSWIMNFDVIQRSGYNIIVGVANTSEVIYSVDDGASWSNAGNNAAVTEGGRGFAVALAENENGTVTCLCGHDGTNNNAWVSKYTISGTTAGNTSMSYDGVYSVGTDQFSALSLTHTTKGPDGFFVCGTANWWIFKSDNGSSWDVIMDEWYGEVRAIDALSNGCIRAIAGEEVLKTVNGDFMQWEVVTTGIPQTWYDDNNEFYSISANRETGAWIASGQASMLLICTLP